MRRLLVVAAVLLTAACGVPVTENPEVLSTTAVPYDLLNPPTTSPPGTTGPRADAGATAAPSVPARAGRTIAVRVAFTVDDQVEQKVTLQRRLVPAGAPAQVAQDLLTQLASGPTETEHTEGLGSAIPPGTSLVAKQVTGGLVTIETGDFTARAPDRLPLAIAQIVLTMTTQPGVDRVLLLQEGEPLDPPRPNGTLISGEELTRSDYASLVH